jgi:glycine dehydrogenase subunit 2
MVEPTETETKQTLDDFANAMKQILKESKENPEIVLSAPQKTPVGRIDEVLAAKEPILTWKMLHQKEDEK